VVEHRVGGNPFGTILYGRSKGWPRIG